ncbi:hypothetical protein WJX72_003917 [[Myrmecia] bisecta]|uniref:Coiled-coil domain-containing protein 40 n=1 Tax=[Myrmecia] bisecta TaxID=41462 RepID=A0AAW1R6K2_9CHLO
MEDPDTPAESPPPVEDSFNAMNMDDGSMDADHPLLARAQEALKKQLQENKLRLEGELREKAGALKQVKRKREDVGVELYGFQQQLAQLQMGLEKARENHDLINKIRLQAEEQVAQLKRAAAEEEDMTQQERVKVEKFQADLDKLAVTLKQVEAYNEQMKNEIAVTRRATYAAEESVQRKEKQKKDQDLLIDNMHQQIKLQQHQLELYSAQFEAQQRETRAARETLADAAVEMENIHHEKKQLAAQWQSSLIAMQRRDEALKATEEAIRQQYEQERSIENEVQAYRKDIVKTQVKNEQLTAVLRKVEGEAQYLQTQNDTSKEKQEALQVTYGKLQRSLESTEADLNRSRQEAKVLESERLAVDKAYVKISGDIKELEQQILGVLSNQTTSEKSSNKTAKDTQGLRQQVYDREMAAVQLQNELAKLEVDILNTESHNDRLVETLKLMDAELHDKMAVIGKYEADLKRRTDEIEKKTKEVDLLNRKYEKLVANMDPGENTGPLEATINNLNREIVRKGEEGRVLQRRWVGWQTELVGLQIENNKLAETLQRLKSEHTVMFQKRQRLNQQQEFVLREVKELDKGMAHLHTDMARFNALIANNVQLREALANDTFILEKQVVNELKDLELEAAKLTSQIEGARGEKRDVLARVVDTERAVLLWERKLQLEAEMAEVMDPTVGTDVVGAMRKEIHRMTLRLTELARMQERLIQEMERCIAKRDTITFKGRAATSKRTPEVTETVLKKALGELERSVRDTKREARATDERLAQLDEERNQLADEVAASTGRCQELQQAEERLRAALDTMQNEKYKALVVTAAKQKVVKHLEQILSGTYKFRADPAQIDAELTKASQKQEKLRAAIEAFHASLPHLQPAFERVLICFAAA